MTDIEYSEQQRQKKIDRALSVNLADGVFQIYYYNDINRNNQIDPFEVFNTVSQSEVQDWLDRSKKLLASNWDVGDALVENCHRKEVVTRERYEKARNELMTNNPGFSEETYERAISDGAAAACH
ncbi:MAG: hypothetical protein PHO27_08675 [Sulfuricurvum sp.]|nr:hypothetical protein [Sulfuricurvum sp.]